LIGLAASALWIGSGRIAGISGVVGNLLLGAPDRLWRALFLIGLLGAGFVFVGFEPGMRGESPRPLGWLALAGLLVGVGTRIGGGCTSGHGVCGVSRLSPRSLVATAIFIVTGSVTVTALRWLGAAS
jgi:uncharacterized membrane protein YedE/YeeE